MLPKFPLKWMQDKKKTYNYWYKNLELFANWSFVQFNSMQFNRNKSKIYSLTYSKDCFPVYLMKIINIFTTKCFYVCEHLASSIGVALNIALMRKVISGNNINAIKINIQT